MLFYDTPPPHPIDQCRAVQAQYHSLAAWVIQQCPPGMRQDEALAYLGKSMMCAVIAVREGPGRA